MLSISEDREAVGAGAMGVRPGTVAFKTAAPPVDTREKFADPAALASEAVAFPTERRDMLTAVPAAAAAASTTAAAEAQIALFPLSRDFS
jgi:hypothetical protein